jgi:hypothetical protein
MKADQIFGFFIILLAIYLGVSASTGASVDGGLFEGGSDIPIVSGALPGDDSGALPGDDSGAQADSAGGTDDRSGEESRDDGARQSIQATAPNERAITDSDFCAAAARRSSYSDLGRVNDAAIRCMEAADVMAGTSASQFDPGDAVTRGQAAAAIAAMIDKANELEADGADLRGLPEPSDPRFRDITPDTPHRLAIARLNETPILQGYVDARYEPRGKVTRAQMASLLDRSYQYVNRAALPIARDRFSDDQTSVHEESINAVAGADIMHGIGDRRFAPRRSVRRGELARYLTLMMVRMEDKNRIVPLPDAPTK